MVCLFRYTANNREYHQRHGVIEYYLCSIILSSGSLCVQNSFVFVLVDHHDACHGEFWLTDVGYSRIFQIPSATIAGLDRFGMPLVSNTCRRCYSTNPRIVYNY